MKKLVVFTAFTVLLLLSGCGRGETAQPSGEAALQVPQLPEQAEELPAAPEQPPMAPELEPAPPQEEKRDLTFLVEGETELLPATRYTGAGYVIYIPDEGWRLEREEEDGMTEERWESVWNDEVELTVYTRPPYPESSAAVTRDLFLADSDYVFEDTEGGMTDDPLVGRESDGDYLCFVTAEGSGGVTYIVAWEYPAEAAEGFGARLRVIADTFAVTGP